MLVWVVAQEPADFDRWVDQQRAPRGLPDDERIEQGRQVFFGSSCVHCHDVRGHGPPNATGPDLTYLATRDTIAAGILPNERGILRGWIIDPQAQKPGTRMPGTQISGDDLEALLDYLQSLH
jgi:cytochrome c oxidase subunit II